MEKPEIITVLEDAQLAHKAGDFVNALKFYEHFFDHALDDDPYALYGVRLSHCLQGWADLATVFPGAKNSLEQKKRQLLDEFLDSKNPESFHDYLCVARQLGVEEQALNHFLQLHAENPDTAARLAKYLWDDLVNAEQWAVCNDLLPEPNQKLDELFSIFDESAKLKEFDPSFNNNKFDQHIVDQLIEAVQQLVVVLRFADRSEELAALSRQFHQAVETREHALLHKQVHAKSSFLFASH